MNQSPPTENNDTTKILALVLISSLATCGLMIPVWMFIGAIVILIQIFRPKPKPKKPVDIPISNEFVSDWKYEIRDK
jgi:hypothetical protein